MNEQIESLNRSKQKLEKEKSESAMEVDELRVNVESLGSKTSNFITVLRIREAFLKTHLKFNKN